MCLARHYNYKLKISAYLDSIKTLKASLEKKIHDVDEKDRKDDLKILFDDVCILESGAKLLLEHEHNHEEEHMKEHKTYQSHSRKSSRKSNYYTRRQSSSKTRKTRLNSIYT